MIGLAHRFPVVLRLNPMSCLSLSKSFQCLSLCDDHGEDPKEKDLSEFIGEYQSIIIFFDFERNLGVVVYAFEFWVLCVLMSQLIHYGESKGGHRYGVGLELLAEYRFQEAHVIIIFGRCCFRLARKRVGDCIEFSSD